MKLLGVKNWYIGLKRDTLGITISTPVCDSQRLLFQWEMHPIGSCVWVPLLQMWHSSERLGTFEEVKPYWLELALVYPVPTFCLLSTSASVYFWGDGERFLLYPPANMKLTVPVVSPLWWTLGSDCEAAVKPCLP